MSFTPFRAWNVWAFRSAINNWYSAKKRRSNVSLKLSDLQPSRLNWLINGFEVARFWRPGIGIEVADVISDYAAKLEIKVFGDKTDCCQGIQGLFAITTIQRWGNELISFRALQVTCDSPFAWRRASSRTACLVCLTTALSKRASSTSERRRDG